MPRKENKNISSMTEISQSIRNFRHYNEFNEPCNCKHRADEHIAGDGHCFLCHCGKFVSAVDKKNV